MPDAALAGVTVLDLTHHVAGPYCTKLLADFGADVIKIEYPDGGDPARRMGPFLHDLPGPERSLYFLALNSNKKSLTLNLKTRKGRELLLALAKDADLVVENFSPGTMERLGLTYAELEAVNPRLVMTSLTNFGQSGPYRDYQMTEIIGYAMGGTMSVTGFSDREPVTLGETMTLYQAGNIAAGLTLGALYGAWRNGEGQHVDLSIMEIQAASIDRAGQNLATIAFSGAVTMGRTPPQGRARNILPNGVYPCQDGYVHVGGGMAGDWWPQFCRMIDRPDLLHSPRYSTQEGLRNLDLKAEVDTLFFVWLMEHTKAEIMERGQAAGYIAVPVNNIEEVLQDPHLQERGFFVTVDHPAVGTLTMPGAPFGMSETPWRAGRAPLLGEHTREVLGERLGYSGEDLVRMRELSVI